MKTPKVSKDPNKNWGNDSIQFPRLIAELETAGVFNDYGIVISVCNEMDISVPQFYNLIERAKTQWDKIKSQTKR